MFELLKESNFKYLENIVAMQKNTSICFLTLSFKP